MKSIFTSLSRPVSLVLIMALTGLISACSLGGDGSNNTQPSATATLQNIQIQVEEQTLIVGLNSKAHAVALYSDNSSLDLSSEASWFSSKSDYASIDANGVITALSPGSTVISAVVRDKTASSTVTIEQGELLSLTIKPVAGPLAIAEQHQFSAEGLFGNGSSDYNFDVTEYTSWSSSDTSKLTILDTAGNKGLGETKDSGNVTITANLGSRTDSIEVNISAVTLSHLEISSTQTSLPINAKLQLQANGIYSDGNNSNLNAQVSWSTSNTDVATIDANGLMTALKIGSVEVTITYQGLTTNTNIEINEATLTAIEVAPINPKLISGESQQFYATAQYSNNTTLDITDQTTWLSSNSNVAKIGNTVVDSGMVTALTEGSSTITANFDNQSQQIDLSVDDALLQSLEITPANSSIAINTLQKFSVTGFYDNGSSRDLTEQVTWSSNNSSDSKLVEQQSEAGYIKATATGISQIIATLDDITSFTNLTITSATLESIIISSTTTKVPTGYSSQLTAIGHFSDGSEQDISDSVSWSSSNENVASINSDSNETELLSDLAGNTTINATFDGVSASTDITVVDASLISVSINTGKTSMNLGTSQTLFATGHFSDDINIDISNQVIWLSSNSTIANISNAETYRGVVTALNSGTVTMTAIHNGISATSNITVTDNPNVAASISFLASPNVILNNGTDNSNITITLQPSSSSGIADNTEIAIQITEGDTITNKTIFTTDGSASFNLSSSYEGFIEIKASVPDSDISLSSNIFSSSSFVSLIARQGFKHTVYADDGITLMSGSWFTLAFKNISNRDFIIDQYQFSIDGVTGITPGTDILGGQLGGGVGYYYQVNIEDRVDTETRADLFLTDPILNMQFSIFADFSSVP